jgi:hypothetical protein
LERCGGHHNNPVVDGDALPAQLLVVLLEERDHGSHVVEDLLPKK